MTLKQSAAAGRRRALLGPLVVEAVVLSLLLARRAAAAAIVAMVGVAGLAAALIWSDQQTLRARRRTGELAAELAQAYIDPVTGLAVRTIAERRIAAAAGTELTVALLDVDDLHGINDAHTHHGGDSFLAALADRLTETAAAGDLVARLGGDEFVIVTGRDPEAVERALTVATRHPVTVGATTVPMHVSIGICQVTGGDPHTALGCADLAMYTAKRRRTGIEHYDPARDGVPLSPGVRPPVRHRNRHPGSRPTGTA
jgi:diguanylate cyclase (GGDEF)-like protein